VRATAHRAGNGLAARPPPAVVSPTVHTLTRIGWLAAAALSAVACGGGGGDDESRQGGATTINQYLAAGLIDEGVPP